MNNMGWELFLIIIILILVLQVFLSKQENELLGLILPLISHIITTILFFGMKGLVSFISTLILLGIYLFYHSHLKKDNEIENQRLVVILLFISHIIAILIYGGVDVYILVLIPILTLLGIYWFLRSQLIRNNELEKWLVLILPFISLIISTLIFNGVVAYIGVFIPTVILLIIYLFSRSHLKKNKELEKMTIKDL